MLVGGPLNILLLSAPVALMSWGLSWSDTVTFIFSLLAIAPLAERLGFVTEQLALHTSETIGGLLNATFGNATELIVAITALNKGLYRLVQLSLLGSVLSNLLLVLGCAFLAGGYYHKTQNYGKVSSQVNSSLMVLMAMGLTFPTALSSSASASYLTVLGFSRAVALVLFLLYFAFLYFQLSTHKELYSDEDPNDNIKMSLLKNDSENQHSVPNDAKVSTTSAEGEEEEEEDILGYRYALVWLAIITVFIAFLSDALSSSIESAATSIGISSVFLSAIVLPIVGNAAEHAGAVMFAMKGKLELTLGVAVGSSTQIALSVLPFLVIIGWMSGNDLDMDFGVFEASSMFMTIVLVTIILKDGTSNWLLGAILIVAYIIIAAGFWAHADEDLGR